MLIQNLEEFQKSVRQFSWNSGENSQNVRDIHGFQSGSRSIYYRISNVVHGGGGGGDIFLE